MRIDSPHSANRFAGGGDGGVDAQRHKTKEEGSAELVEIVATPIVRDEDDNFLSVVTKELRRLQCNYCGIELCRKFCRYLNWNSIG